MTYAASYFRANMWEILDKIRYNRECATIWRRWKKEFYIIPVELYKEENIKDNKDFEVITDKNIVNVINSVNWTNSDSLIFW